MTHQQELPWAPADVPAASPRPASRSARARVSTETVGAHQVGHGTGRRQPAARGTGAQAASGQGRRVPGPPRRAAPYDDDWRLDERTRRVGRRGLAAARAALARTGVRADHAA